MITLALVLAGILAGWWLGMTLSARRHQCQADAGAPSADTPFTLAAADRTPFAAIAQATNDAVWDYDCARQRLWWSAHADRLFGAPPGTSLDDWMAGIHPEDRTRIQARMQSVLEGHTNEWADEYRYRRPDGSLSIFSTAARPCETTQDSQHGWLAASAM